MKFPTDLWHMKVDRGIEASSAESDRNNRELVEAFRQMDLTIARYDGLRERVRAKLPHYYLDFETGLIADMTVNQMKMFMSGRYTPSNDQIEALARRMRVR